MKMYVVLPIDKKEAAINFCETHAIIIEKESISFDGLDVHFKLDGVSIDLEGFSYHMDIVNQYTPFFE